MILENVLFLDAPGGTIQTFLISLLLASIKKRMPFLWLLPGISAILLDGWRTVHSTFKLPLNMNHTETPVCNISKQRPTIYVLTECKLIVLDEVTMTHKGGTEALELSKTSRAINVSWVGWLYYWLGIGTGVGWFKTPCRSLQHKCASQKRTWSIGVFQLTSSNWRWES